MAEKSTNNQEVKSKRDSFRERLASRYPDLDMNDEEAVYNQLSRRSGSWRDRTPAAGYFQVH